MILDTCALLFLVSGDTRLTLSTRERLAQDPERAYCAISAFEVALKCRQGKLELPMDPLSWMREVERRYGLSEVAIDTALCAAAAALPLHHRDPFDRFIIAAALERRTPVVTIDQKFHAYGVEVFC